MAAKQTEKDSKSLPTGLEPQGDTYAYIKMPGQIANSLAYSTTLVRECVFHVNTEEQTLESTHVDPANVGMGHPTLKLDTDLGVSKVELTGDITVGVNLEWLRGRLKWARVGRGGLDTGDDVHLLIDGDARKIHVRVEKDVTRTSTAYTIDPDSVRQEPEIPDLELPCQAEEISHSQLYQGVQAAKQASEHARITGRVMQQDGTPTGDLIIQAEGDTTDEHIVIEEVADAATPLEATSSLFSIDYLWDISRALKRAKPERVTINWGSEFPTKIRYHHSEWGIEGEFMLAPRIQSD